jgi:hypothetical protein
MGDLLLPRLVSRSGKGIREHVLHCAGHREKAAVIIAEELGDRVEGEGGVKLSHPLASYCVNVYKRFGTEVDNTISTSLAPTRLLPYHDDRELRGQAEFEN